jgi:hypothetical protein
MGNVFMAPTVETNATSLARFNLELFKDFDRHRRELHFPLVAGPTSFVIQ